MELVYRAAALALTAAVLTLVIRKKNPEMASLLSIAAITAVLLAALRYAEAFRELTATVRTLLDGSESYLLPVLKCLAAAIVTRIASDLCRDASQTALASAVELTGAVCAVGISLPMILAVLKRIGGLL
ncbi:MAG: stage III sporulation protein AD [Oscillospiraceae bacterium]|jgi:Stage III sporulation protein AC/AD protein family.|nr:stage III sporulation protein AD [Oscillospiraceae bacterium]